MCGKKGNRTFLQKLLPCKTKIYDGDLPPPPPPYTLTNMQSTPYGASATHIPATFSTEVKPDVFNVWGITGYTGSIDTSGNLNPADTACHLAKIQQAMSGYNRFDHTKFTQTSPPAPAAIDITDNKTADIPKPPDPAEADKQHLSYSGYCPVYPGYGYNFGLAPPPCPPEPPKEEKKPKEDDKCKHCAGASGHPVKRIKKLDGGVLCWACVWRAYASAAEEVWRESGDVKGGESGEE